MFFFSQSFSITFTGQSSSTRDQFETQRENWKRRRSCTESSTCFCVKRNQNNSRCTYLCNVSRVSSATWRMQKIKVYGAQLVLSRISHQLFFHQLNFIFHHFSFSRNDFNFPERFQLSFSTLTFSHDFNFPARLQLSSTTLTFRHDVNFPTVLQ